MSAVKFIIKEIENLITIETFPQWQIIKKEAEKIHRQDIINACEDLSNLYLTGSEYYEHVFNHVHPEETRTAEEERQKPKKPKFLQNEFPFGL